MKTFLTVTLLLFLLTNTKAQNSIIQGKIVNQDNTPLEGASVLIKNTSKGTYTNAKGKFKIKHLAKGKQSLFISYLGYVSKEVEFTDATKLLQIILKKDNFGLDEVLIVSNRDKETINEIPSSVAIITSTKLTEISQSSNVIADVLANIPGVSLSNNTTSNTGQTLRGRKMLVMIDGIPQSTPLRNGSRDINTIDPSVLERIEIIKGATSIYGNGADGGIVNYITKRPDENKKFSSATTIGSTGSLVNTDNTIGSYLSQQFMGKIDKFKYVVSAGFKQTGIFRSAQNEIISPYYGLGETDSYNIFTKIGYDFNENHSIEVMSNYYSSNQNSNYIEKIGKYESYPAVGVLGGSEGEDQGNRYNRNLQLKYSLSNLFAGSNLDVSLYYQDFKTVYGYSSYFTDNNLGYSGGQSQIESTKKGTRFNFKTPYSINESISGNFVYGLDILNDNTSQTLADGRVWVPETVMNNIAPYLQIKTKYKDFVFKGGVRFENIAINIDDYKTLFIDAYGAGTSLSGGVAVKGGDLKYNATVFNLGLRYNKLKAFQPFASISQSFSISDLGRTLRTAKQNTVGKINSEALIVNNYEVGFTSNFTNINIQGASYISTSKLGSTFIENPNTQEFEVLRQPEKVYGFELQLDSKMTESLHIGASYSYVEGKFDGDANGNYDDAQDGYLGGDRISPSVFRSYIRYQFSSKWKAKLSSAFSGSRNRFEPGSNGAYSYGKGRVTNFTTTNLYSSYQLTPTTKLAMGIENLFNEDYYTMPSQWRGRSNAYNKGNGTNFNISLSIQL